MALLARVRPRSEASGHSENSLDDDALMGDDVFEPAPDAAAKKVKVKITYAERKKWHHSIQQVSCNAFNVSVLLLSDCLMPKCFTTHSTCTAVPALSQVASIHDNTSPSRPVRGVYDGNIDLTWLLGLMCATG